MPRVLVLVAVCAATCLALAGDPPAKTALRFDVTAAKGLLASPQDGRVLIALGRSSRGEPRLAIGEVGPGEVPILGRDANGFTAGATVTLDASAVLFPYGSLSRLPKGEYVVQAVFHYNRDLNFANAPDNLVSEPKKVTLDPAAGGVVKLELTRKLPPDQPPADTEEVKFLKLRSEKLSKFYGRPMYLRAGVVLPAGWAKDADKRYPLRVHIGGYGTRYTAARGMRGRSPGLILLHLDGAGPLGDPYQVDSANHGPYGAAITQVLIPHVEKRFRGIGEGYARVTDGASTGGWVSLALQVFYPDFFNGCWSHAPDPVDFRAYERINIYRDDNAYVDADGKERPACRDISGRVRYTVRHECLSEIVLGRGDNWAVSGKDWCAWNATFGPRGKDGLPVPLWDGKTGKIDRGVLEHWKKYDLRMHLEKNWATLGPKLHGKLRIWVGETDDYYLNEAVHLLDAFLKRAKPAYGGKVVFGPGGHGFRVLSERQLVAEMLAAVEKAKPGR
jgi:hypothetical protein